MNKGISIVMSYHNRRKQLINTLKSINKTKFNKNKLEIIIINDNSSYIHNINDLPFIFNNLNIKILNIKKEEKTWLNSCIPYNMGFNFSKYDKIIIQNPECYHNDDILCHVDNNLNDKNYLTYSCYSLNNIESTYNDFNNITRLDKMFELAGSSGWYNHSIYRPSYYHFCSAITKKNLNKIKGFDEEYKDGIGWDDNELLFRIKLLNIDIEIVDNHTVYHQYHKSENYRYSKDSPSDEINNKNKLFNKNKSIYNDKTLKLKSYKVNNKIYK